MTNHVYAAPPLAPPSRKRKGRFGIICQKCLFSLRVLVLPDRIELSTSPLPMECSTTELRQHARYVRIGPKGPLQAAGSCHKDPSGASTRRGREGPKTGKIRVGSGSLLQTGPTRADPVPFCQLTAAPAAERDESLRLHPMAAIAPRLGEIQYVRRKQNGATAQAIGPECRTIKTSARKKPAAI